ncbi:hypothetical protein ACTS95_10000 [Empedobacter brevis]
MNIIPSNIQSELAKYIREKCPHAESGWVFSNQDEDSVTGDFLGNLRSNGWIENRDFKYRFYYNKVRGRGKGALEKETGADGIITIELTSDGKTKFKSFVFQAKKIGNKTDEIQVKKMNFLFPNANVVFRYGPNGYFVENFEDKEIRICEFIADIFLKCKVGIIGLRYDANINRIRMNDGRFKKSKFVHELVIEVQE